MDISQTNPNDEAPSRELADALARWDVELSADQASALEAYCRHLWDWNERLNLTRHTDYDKFVSRDLVDSQQLSQLLEADEAVLDLGSGGGVPGVVLAVLRPDLQISLSESVGKKAAALQDIVNSLKMSTPVHRSRAEDLLDDFRFDAVVARAVGPLWKILKWVAPHWGSIGRLLLIKGPRWVEERGEARHRGALKGLELRRAVEYRTPGTDAVNVILRIQRKRKPG